MATLQSKVRVPADVLFREIDGEAVILSLDTGRYFGLDPVGTRMWQELNRHGGVERAHRTLAERYDIDAERLLADLLSMIDKLVVQGLLVVDET